MTGIPEAAILDALAEAFAEVSRSLSTRAGALRERSTLDSVDGARSSAVTAARAAHPAIGRRQLELIALLEEAGVEGTNTGALARRMGYTQPNVHLTLRRLIELGLVRRDASARPHRYFLASLTTSHPCA